MSEKKRKWITPQLIVLVRGKPEEGVLQGCKSSETGGGMTSHNLRCNNFGGVDCYSCMVEPIS